MTVPRKPRRDSVHTSPVPPGALSVLLVSLAPLAYVLVRWASPTVSRLVPLAIGGLLAASGLLRPDRRILARVLASAGLLAIPVVGARAFARAPASTLLTLAALVVLLCAVWEKRPSASIDEPRRWPSARALAVGQRVAALGGVLSAVVAGFNYGWLPPEMGTVCAVALGLPIALGLGWAVRAGDATIVRRAVSVAAAAAAAIAWAVLEAPWNVTVLPALLLLSLLASAVRDAGGSSRGVASLGVASRAAALVVLSFLLLCGVGSVLLALPSSAGAGLRVSVLDAAFTAVSAVCVTGLIVVDTPSAFSPMGHVWLLILIQLGGLGIMGLYAVVLQLIGRRLTLSQEASMSGALGLVRDEQLFVALRRVFMVTLASEAIGTVVLAGAFLGHGDAMGRAVWRGLFTAVSAFCNAGFALQSDSLVGYQRSPVVLHTVAALIVAGGLSPAVVSTIPRLVRPGHRRVPLQTRMVVFSSIALLLGGAVLYGSFEWSASLARLPWWDRLQNAWFQSATVRTAGFNSVDLLETTAATRTLLMMLMFIGGSPGGTAGGVKTTTVALLVLVTLAALGSKTQARTHRTAISLASSLKAAAAVSVSGMVVVAALLAMQLTQRIPFDVAAFEVVSALGTVGLSLGGTGLLDEVGKVLVMVVMFVGRVGPLTLFALLAGQQPRTQAGVPTEEVNIG